MEITSHFLISQKLLQLLGTGCITAPKHRREEAARSLHFRMTVHGEYGEDKPKINLELTSLLSTFAAAGSEDHTT